MKYVSGELLTPLGFESGYLGFDQNAIVERGKGTPPKKPVAKGWIVPSLINSHTHIGDAFIQNKKIDLPKDVDQLVAPPDGLKHKFLRDATDEEIQLGIKKAADTMISHGTSCFCDFREGGIKGINQLHSALRDKKIDALCLSRPIDMSYHKEEIDLLLNESHGIGLSGISDWDYSKIEKIAFHTHKRKRLFALHCSEIVREDIDLVLDLKPDFLVHMVKATQSDLEVVKEANVPIVVCPRSNVFFNLKPNLPLMKKVGVTILLGTDNAMITNPNILEEVVFVKQMFNEFSFEELLKIAIYHPRKALNLERNILGLSSPPNFIVISENSLKPLYIPNM